MVSSQPPCAEDSECNEFAVCIHQTCKCGDGFSAQSNSTCSITIGNKLGPIAVSLCAALALVVTITCLKKLLGTGGQWGVPDGATARRRSLYSAFNSPTSSPVVVGISGSRSPTGRRISIKGTNGTSPLPADNKPVRISPVEDGESPSRRIPSLPSSPRKVTLDSPPTNRASPQRLTFEERSPPRRVSSSAQQSPMPPRLSFVASPAVRESMTQLSSKASLLVSGDSKAKGKQIATYMRALVCYHAMIVVVGALMSARIIKTVGTAEAVISIVSSYPIAQGFILCDIWLNLVPEKMLTEFQRSHPQDKVDVLLILRSIVHTVSPFIVGVCASTFIISGVTRFAGLYLVADVFRTIARLSIGLSISICLIIAGTLTYRIFSHMLAEQQSEVVESPQSHRGGPDAKRLCRTLMRKSTRGAVFFSCVMVLWCTQTVYQQCKTVYTEEALALRQYDMSTVSYAVAVINLVIAGLTSVFRKEGTYAPANLRRIEVSPTSRSGINV